MKTEDFTKRLNSRSGMYAEGRVMDPTYPIVVRVDPRHACKFESQVALIVLASLLSRVTGNITFDLPTVAVHDALPWKDKILPQLIKNEVCLNRPDNNYKFQEAQAGDYILNIGPDGGAVNIHGSGWFSFVGISPSPLPERVVLNPVGAMMAAITAVALLFDVVPQPITANYVFDAFLWESGDAEFCDHPYKPSPLLGDLWFVGLGSVGSCALYLLTLATRNFAPALVDMDKVEVENMDRSAIFHLEHEGHYKVKAAESFLNSIGIVGAQAETKPFHHSALLKNRQMGEPDIIISAANEYNVRYTTEHAMPPVQLYATTGENFQTTLLRHIPLVDPCSCCVFPPEVHKAATVCAGIKIEEKDTGKKIDAALPFLSYMAGLMTVAEILKLSLSGYPFTANKVQFLASPKKRKPRFLHVKGEQKAGCVCQTRHEDVHKKLIAGSKYAILSGIENAALLEIKNTATGKNESIDA